jgi:acetylornithine deacetylase/succinyl-diaminopimelate desuccinylase-like protein
LVAGYTQEGVKTINPAVAKAKIDFRLIPDQQPEDILEKLRAHLREGGFDDVDVEHKASFESASTPISSAIGRALIQGCEDVYARPPNVFPWSIGSGPTSFYTKVGTPTGTAPGVNYTGSRIHAPNEHIRLADARNAIKAVASAILAFADIAGSSVRHS